MKVVSFNPWKRIVLKTIVSSDDPMLDNYAAILKEHGDYFIGVTEPDTIEELEEKGFEEINIVAVDELSFNDILNIVKKEISNEELIEIFEEIY
jgi:hypothetical protein